MLSENTLLWLDALMSGDYQQTDSTLRDDAGFCCLGVAEDICPLTIWQVSDYGTWSSRTETNDDSEKSELTRTTMQWLGVSYQDPILNNPEIHSQNEAVVSVNPYVSCAALNDAHGFSFVQIADMIRYFGFRENVYA